MPGRGVVVKVVVLVLVLAGSRTAHNGVPMVVNAD